MSPDLPEFELNIDAQGRPKFAHPGQAYAYLRQYANSLIAGQFFPFRGKRSDRQNRAVHVLISLWGKERGWHPDTLKQFVLGRIFGWLEFVDPLSGEVIKVLAEPHSSKLPMDKFCLLIEGVLTLAAEDGVWLQSPEEYRRAKESLDRRAARKAAKVA